MQFFCRICFLPIFDSSSSVALDHKSHKYYQLIFCIPEVDLRTFPDAKLCKECITALDVTYKFKMTCREAEDQMNKQQFNVIEHSRVMQDRQLDNSIYTICRTCNEDVIDSSFCLVERSFYKSKLMFCVPEMDLQVILNINLCNKCHIILDKIYTFKMKGLNIEKNIKEYLKLHEKVNFRDLSVWCNAFVKYEVSDLEDYAIKQENLDFINDDELTEAMEEETTNATLNTLKTEGLKTCSCIQQASNYQNCKCIYDNIEHILPNKSENNSKNSKCDYNTVQKHYLPKQVKPYVVGKLFKCLLCEYSTVKISHIKLHIRTHTGEKPFKCSLCEYSAVQKSHLKIHIRTHTGEKPFKCSLCEYSSVQKSELKKHIHTHTGEKPFKCSLCEYSTVTKSHLKTHIYKHTGEKPFKCSLCEYSTVIKSHLKTHIRTHTGEKPFKCLLCDYSAAQKSHLKIHIQTHTGEKPFKCSVCEYSTIQKFQLKIHNRMHTGEKPFKCSLCEYSSVQKSDLKRHMYRHTGKKPFKCSLCEYSAVKEADLKIHVHTHTGDKPFKCSLCGYSSVQKSNLKRHINTHHTGENS